MICKCSTMFFRWLIELGSATTAGALVYRCIQINGERIKCHLYDKLMEEEYIKYKKKHGVKDGDDTVNAVLSEEAQGSVG